MPEGKAHARERSTPVLPARPERDPRSGGGSAREIAAKAWSVLPPEVKGRIRRGGLFELYRKVNSRFEINRWHRLGRPSPPPHAVKQQILVQHRRAFGVHTLIESGTYRGDMIWALRREFKSIISIELGSQLFREAQSRFAKLGHIRLIRGDSSQVLPEILAQLSEPCLFWLDAHFSGGRTARGISITPIKDEIDLILEHGRDHVMLIDDARLFTGEHEFPTLEDLKVRVGARRPEWSFYARNDVIRIHPALKARGQSVEW